MPSPTLGELRLIVKQRLRDFAGKLDPAEIDAEINRNLDIWTRDSEVLQFTLVQDITAGVNPVPLVVAPGFEIAAILGIQANIGVYVGPVELKTVRELDLEWPDWRDSSNTATQPRYAVLNFDATSPAKVVLSSLWLAPWPAGNLTGGLVVDYIAATYGYLKQDDDRVPLEAVQCVEWLVEQTCAELAHRMEMEQIAAYHEKTSQREGGRQRSLAAKQGRSAPAAKVYFY